MLQTNPFDEGLTNADVKKDVVVCNAEWVRPPMQIYSALFWESSIVF